MQLAFLREQPRRFHRMSLPVLDLSTGTRTVIRMRQPLSLLTMAPTLVTGIETEIERDAVARGNGTEIGTGTIKMIKMTTERHARGERARVMMVEKGRRSGDDPFTMYNIPPLTQLRALSRRVK